MNAGPSCAVADDHAGSVSNTAFLNVALLNSGDIQWRLWELVNRKELTEVR